MYAKQALLPYRIRWAIRAIPSPLVIVVGANDGKTGDAVYPLLKSGRCSHALLIEPVPYLYKRLVRTSARFRGCECINIAVGPERGIVPIYFIDPAAGNVVPGLPPYYEELGSFDRDRVANTLPPDHRTYIREHSATTMPLRDVLAERGITRVDLLQIDTEGFDYEVLKTFPFETSPPKIVVFEHCHLSSSDRQAAKQLLQGFDYRIEPWGKDYVCVQRVICRRQSR